MSSGENWLAPQPTANMATATRCHGRFSTLALVRRLLGPHRLGLLLVHPQLPPSRRGPPRLVEAVGAAAGELEVAHARCAAEHGSDAAVRPTERGLDDRERSGLSGRVGQRVEKRAHQVAGAVVEPGDLVRVVHGVVRRVLGEPRGQAVSSAGADSRAAWMAATSSRAEAAVSSTATRADGPRAGSAKSMFSVWSAMA